MSVRESGNRTAETPTSSLGKKFNGNRPLVVVLWLSKSKKKTDPQEKSPFPRVSKQRGVQSRARCLAGCCRVYYPRLGACAWTCIGP